MHALVMFLALLALNGSLAAAPQNGSAEETVLFAFDGADGSRPQFGTLIADANGALFGTTYGGTYGADGSVFKLTPGRTGYTEGVIYSAFSQGPAFSMTAGLLAGPRGVLYFPATAGGEYGQGGVFALTPSGSVYSINTL